MKCWGVEQTVIGEAGNCYAACLATILQVPLCEVPIPENPRNWIEAMNVYREWVSKFNLSLVDMSLPDFAPKKSIFKGNKILSVGAENQPEEILVGEYEDIGYTEEWESRKQEFMPSLSILAVRSPRIKGYHAVVAYNGEVLFDPHPQREMGLGQWVEVTLFATLLPIIKPSRGSSSEV